MDIPSKSSQERAGRAQNDQCSKVQQIPTSQVKELSDESISDDESAIILTNLHSRQTLEEVVTGEHPKPLVEVKPPALTQPEYAIPDNSYQGETSGDHTVLVFLEGRTQLVPSFSRVVPNWCQSKLPFLHLSA